LLTQGFTKKGVVMSHLHAYTDGSFNKDNQKWGYGVVFQDLKDELKGSGDSYIESWQVAAECKAAIEAIGYAIRNGYKDVTIHYDFDGVKKWITEEWKVKEPVSKEYKELILKYREQINVHWEYVKAHVSQESGGHPLNARAHQLAKEASGAKTA
jgi:ribonuclease HI